MANMSELLQDYVNKDYKELVSFGNIALGKLLPAFKEADPENNGMTALASVVLAAVGADGKLSVLETKWLKDVMGLQDESIKKLIKQYTPQVEDLTKILYDNLSKEYKAHLLTFILSILAVDEKISKEETAFVKKLFA